MSAGVDAELVEKARGWRRDFHRHPELAWHETRTAGRVAEILGDAGLEIRRGYGGTGLVATLHRGDGAREIMLRADMDALPIREASGVDHASAEDGVMHACGHDGHTAMLLGAAVALAQDGDFDGIVHFLFQPAEENEAGAKAMIEDGVLDDIDPAFCFAAHNWPDLPVGRIAAPEGPIMAAFAVFDIEVTGTGAHAAMPHGGEDTILTAARIVEALNGIVSREIDPLAGAVVSVTKVHGGDAYNALPETVALAGTARWLDPEVGDLLERRVGEIVEGIAAAQGCGAEVRYERRYPVTRNEAEAARAVRDIAPSAGLDVADAGPSMAAEDFAFFLERCPGCYFWLGSRDDTHEAGLHAPQFDFNDALLPLGIDFWTRLVEAQLPVSR